MSTEENNIDKNYISIYFNNPFNSSVLKVDEEEIIAQDDDKINTVEYNLILKIPSSEITNTSLFSLREKISDCIIQSNSSITKDDMTSYHFKPNATSSQLKGIHNSLLIFFFIYILFTISR